MHYYDKIHRGEKRLFIKFPIDKSITERLKKIVDCTWSQTEKAWHVEASLAVFGKLKDAFPQLQPLKPSAETNLVDKTKPSAKSAKAQKLTVKVVQYKTGRFRVIAYHHPVLESILTSKALSGIKSPLDSLDI